MSSDVLLIEPWITDFAAFDLWRKPLGLLYVGALLERAGMSSRFESALEVREADDPGDGGAAGWHRGRKKRFGTAKFPWQAIPTPAPLADMPRQYKRYGATPAAFAERLARRGRPRVVFVGSMMTYWYPGVVETIRVAREVWPDAPIVLGGVYASLCPDHARRVSGADEVAVGRADDCLPHVVAKRLGATVRVETDRRAWPSPAYHLFGRTRSISVASSWGCPFRCAYCASATLAGGFIERDPVDVLDEVARLLATTGASDVAFFDDAFLVNADARAKPILRGVARRFKGVRFHLPNGVHARLIDAEVADLLVAADVRTVRLALEGLTGRVAALSDRKVSQHDLARALDRLDRAGFARSRAEVYVLVGLPGQSEASVADAVRFAGDLGARVHLCEFSPIPGTRVWSRLGDKAAALSREPLLANNKALFLWDVTDRFDAIARLKERVRRGNAELTTRSPSDHGRCASVDVDG